MKARVGRTIAAADGSRVEFASVTVLVLAIAPRLNEAAASNFWLQPGLYWSKRMESMLSKTAIG
jgi:hypothetical protein